MKSPIEKGPGAMIRTTTVVTLVLATAISCQHAPSRTDAEVWCSPDVMKPDDTGSPEKSAADAEAERQAFAKGMAKYSREIQSCYEKLLRRDETVEGRVSAVFAIDEEGRVQTACLDRSETTISDRALHNCILDAAMRWRLTEVKRDKPVFVHYPYELRSCALRKCQ